MNLEKRFREALTSIPLLDTCDRHAVGLAVTTPDLKQRLIELVEHAKQNGDGSRTVRLRTLVSDAHGDYVLEFDEVRVEHHRRPRPKRIRFLLEAEAADGGLYHMTLASDVAFRQSGRIKTPYRANVHFHGLLRELIVSTTWEGEQRELTDLLKRICAEDGFDVNDARPPVREQKPGDLEIGQQVVDALGTSSHSYREFQLRAQVCADQGRGHRACVQLEQTAGPYRCSVSDTAPGRTVATALRNATARAGQQLEKLHSGRHQHFIDQ